MIIIKATYPNEEESDKSIKNLLNKKLIASANSFPIKSTSNRSGRTEKVDEFLVLFKTLEENWKNVKKEIESTHPYKVPCILKFNASANEIYSTWVTNETSSPKN